MTQTQNGVSLTKSKRKMQTIFLFITMVTFYVPVAFGEEIKPPFEEDFDDNEVSPELTVHLQDFPDTGGTLTIEDGQLILINTTGGGDVATATVESSKPGEDFSVSVDVIATTFEFTGSTRVGVVARANDATSYNPKYSGYYAYVQELDHSGSRYVLRLGMGDSDRLTDIQFEVLAESDEFDLSDGSPDFSIMLKGEFQNNGDLELTAEFKDEGKENRVDRLKETVPANRVLKFGNKFGLRAQTGNNPNELRFDNIVYEE